MTGKFPLACAISTALLLASATTSPPASAQTGTRVAPTTELGGVMVIAPRITHRRDHTGRHEVAEQSALVDFSDLNLARTNDFYVLEDRVADTAVRICNELADMYPEGRPATDVCIRRAIDDAMVQVRDAARRHAAMAAYDD